MKKKTIDKRIAKLSFAKFEKEFGFKPKNKAEQEYFALHGHCMNNTVRQWTERREVTDAQNQD